MKNVISSKEAPAAIGPYSQAIKCGNFLFTSGQIPIDPSTGELAEGGVEAQTRRVLDNLSAVLKEAGASFDNVIKTTVFIKDMNDFAAVNRIYSEYFHEPYPARSCVQVAKLPRDVSVEIEVIAQV